MPIFRNAALHLFVRYAAAPATLFRRPTARSLFRCGVVPAFFAASTVIFINDNVLEHTRITGSSMSPTLSPLAHETGEEDGVVWRKWAASKDVKRGDVVIFHTPHRPEEQAVKRVVALEGDTVVLDKRRRPGRARSTYDDDSNDELAARAWDAWGGEVRVPWGHVWVEGDNWRKSMDSNHYGPISQSLITGRASTVLLPFKRFGLRPWEHNVNRTKVIPAKNPPPIDFEQRIDSFGLA